MPVAEYVSLDNEKMPRNGFGREPSVVDGRRNSFNDNAILGQLQKARPCGSCICTFTACGFRHAPVCPGHDTPLDFHRQFGFDTSTLSIIQIK
ncbi:MAG: hypothetical protein WD767_03435 [Alphaproteobacteria bacterium]